MRRAGSPAPAATLSTASLFAEVDENVRPTASNGHRHEAEIAQELAAAGIGAPLVFTPQVVPLRRGMLVCAYAFFSRAPDRSAGRGGFPPRLRRQPVRPHAARRSRPGDDRRRVQQCRRYAVAVRGRVVRVLCAIDNLGKGAAGQAVQNLNVMFGLPEESALDDLALAR